MTPPEQTGDLTHDLGHAVAYFPIFLVQWVLGLILVVLSDYTIFTFLVGGVAVGLATSLVWGIVAFFVLYSVLRLVSEVLETIIASTRFLGMSITHRNTTPDVIDDAEATP